MTTPDLSGITRALYIKLGSGGKWAQLCFKGQTLRLGYYEVSHDAARAGDLAAIKKIYEDSDASVASNHARQVMDFYNAGPETLWITFENGLLYWCVVEGDVEYLGLKNESPHGSRLRRTSMPWKSESLNGKPLLMSELSGRLTQLAAYRQTICGVKDDVREYLLLKILGKESADIIAVKKTFSELKGNVLKLVQLLQPNDFELLTDLIFAHGGWQRVGILGGQVKTADLELFQPLTNMQAVVQVKSRTSQNELNEYIDRFSQWPRETKFFFVYHSSREKLTADETVTLIGPDDVAAHVIRSGLYDWLLKKTG